LPAMFQWTGPGRLLTFVLSAASIWCLLSEMYGLCDMRVFFYFILLPATAALYGIAVLDRFAPGGRGDRRLFRAVMLGTLAGLCGAVVYDIFRLPFVFSDAWGMGKIGIPQMPLFKVFPRFGALILGEPLEQQSYSAAAHGLGWFYHFSNGATFGVMFAAMYAWAKEAIGAARIGAWKPVFWATLMAVGIEICLLLSPYAKFFNIHMTTRFVVVTMVAHIIFGLGMGAYFAWHARLWRLPTPLLKAA
ncbi:MAG: hypothetical protein L0219_14820, partial [Phycisphaerales bacterium]|nr:hypothetical protein [Phycisphaerales bacterium]